MFALAINQFQLCRGGEDERRASKDCAYRTFVDTIYNSAHMYLPYMRNMTKVVSNAARIRNRIFAYLFHILEPHKMFLYYNVIDR